MLFRANNTFMENAHSTVLFVSIHIGVNRGSFEKIKTRLFCDGILFFAWKLIFKKLGVILHDSDFWRGVMSQFAPLITYVMMIWENLNCKAPLHSSLILNHIDHYS